MATKRKFDEPGFQQWLTELYDWIYKIHGVDLGDTSSANREYLMEAYEDGEHPIDIAIRADKDNLIEPE